MIKIITINLALLLLAAIAFDTSAALWFRSSVQRIDRRYMSDSSSWFGKPFPRYHLMNVANRGSDIAPNVRATARLPIELEAYPVWGNSAGCFDDEWSDEPQPRVYLAGDSFTWGWAPRPRQFGTLLERSLKTEVMQCGVLHTGQRHQFLKFQDVLRHVGSVPSVVVVNVYENDIANDFAFPHSKVIDGYLVEDSRIIIKKDGASLVRQSEKDLKAQYKRELDSRKSLISNLKGWATRHSASYIITREMFASIYKYFKECNGCEIRTSFYDLYEGSDKYPIHADFAKENRAVLKKWLKDSYDKNYHLIFALIPSKHKLGMHYYSDLEKYLDGIGADHVNFEDYLVSQGVSPKTAYLDFDTHFSNSGHRAYAEFLRQAVARRLAASR